MFSSYYGKPWFIPFGPQSYFAWHENKVNYILKSFANEILKQISVIKLTAMLFSSTEGEGRGEVQYIKLGGYPSWPYREIALMFLWPLMTWYTPQTLSSLREEEVREWLESKSSVSLVLPCSAPSWGRARHTAKSKRPVGGVMWWSQGPDPKWSRLKHVLVSYCPADMVPWGRPRYAESSGSWLTPSLP